MIEGLIEEDVQKAIEIAKKCKGTTNFSQSLLHRQFLKGNMYASKLLMELEERGIIKPYNGKAYREII